MNNANKFIVGSRYLIKDTSLLSNPNYYEITVLEISPGGQYVKIERPTDKTLSTIYWDHKDFLEIVEKLGNKKKKGKT